ncbi:MAG: FadR family transcriptional regulator [Rhodobacteraceae bacterium]|nr:FadR family transcriptional regulator [Paracoccaceae bacterium]
MSEPGSIIRALAGRPAARNFHTYVINEVGLAIVSGQIKVGEILPGDGDMMARFGVSRTVLREALKTLEAKGLVEARAKVGTRVLPQARWSLYDRQVLAWVLESGPSETFLAAFRLIRQRLEIEAAGLAARHRDGEQLRMMHYWIAQRGKLAHQPEPFAMAEFELHRLIAEASANPFLRAASAMVEFGVAITVNARLDPQGNAPAEGLSARAAAQYNTLLAAIEAGQADRAQEVMAEILDLGALRSE